MVQALILERMEPMAGRQYPPELRERAVWMVLEHQHEYPSQWTAIISIAGKFGMTCETLRRWVRQVEVVRGRGLA
jgi:transposase